jgi:hypothetical protein
VLSFGEASKELPVDPLASAAQSSKTNCQDSAGTDSCPPNPNPNPNQSKWKRKYVEKVDTRMRFRRILGVQQSICKSQCRAESSHDIAFGRQNTPEEAMMNQKFWNPYTNCPAYTYIITSRPTMANNGVAISLGMIGYRVINGLGGICMPSRKVNECCCMLRCYVLR